MRKIIIALFALPLLFSCSGNDDSSDSSDNPGSQDYLPVESGKYWVYTTNTETSQTTGRDSLYTANDTVINSITYKKFKTKDAPTGFYSGSLSGNGVRQNGSKVMVSGGTSLALSEEYPLSLSVTDFTFFDAAAGAGTTIGTTSNTFEQPTQDGYTVQVNYTMSAVAQQDLESYTLPNGTIYNNIKMVTITLNIGINALIEYDTYTVPIQIMVPQDALVSTQYYAEGVGAVYVSTDIDYELAADFSSLGIDLPIPSAGTEHQEEVLVDHN